MENKKKNDATKPRQLSSDDLTLTVGAAEDAAILIRDLIEDYFLAYSTEKQDGVRSILWDFDRARAWATSLEFQVEFILRELQSLGASR